MKGKKELCKRLNTFLVALFVVFSSVSLALSPLVTSSVKAVSDYDDDYQTVAPLTINSNGECDPLLDVSYNWSTYMDEDDDYASFQTAIETGSWGVSQLPNYGGGTGFSAYIVYWKEVGDMTLRWGEGGTPEGYIEALGTDHIKIIQLSCNPSGPNEGEWNGFKDVSDFGAAYVSGDGGDVINYFYNGEVSYPPDYEGDPINTEPVGLPQYPDFGYTVFPDYALKALYLRNLHDLNDTVNNWGYTLYNATEAWEEDGEYIDYQSLDLFEPYDFQLPGKGQYLLRINIQVSPPGAPRDDIQQITFKINANGTLQDGSTINDDCTDGVCEPPSPYEDCDTYDSLDIIGGVGCHLRNAMTFLRLALIELFIPNVSFMTNYWTSLTDFLNEKLGFIYQSIAQIVSLLGAMITNAATTDCTYDPGGEIFGAEFELDICQFEDNFPTAWAVLSSLIRGLTVLAIVFAFNRKYHDVVEAR